MRLLVVIYDGSIDETLTDRLKALNLPGYTKLFNAEGGGGRGPKLGDAVWPGLNNLLLLAVEEERVPEVVAAIREVQGRYRLKPGISIYSLPAEAL